MKLTVGSLLLVIQGLMLLKGEYIYSVDADDLLQPIAIAALVQAAEESRADVVGCEYLLQEGMTSATYYSTRCENRWRGFCSDMLWANEVESLAFPPSS